MKDFGSEEDLSDEDIIKYRKNERVKSKSPIPSDPTLLQEFCERNLSKIFKQNKLSLDDVALEIKVILVKKCFF
jgi:hypothetical protein